MSLLNLVESSVAQCILCLPLQRYFRGKECPDQPVRLHCPLRISLRVHCIVWNT